MRMDSISACENNIISIITSLQSNTSLICNGLLAKKTKLNCKQLFNTLGNSRNQWYIIVNTKLYIIDIVREYFNILKR